MVSIIDLVHPETGTYYDDKTNSFFLFIHGVGKIAEYNNLYDKEKNKEVDRMLWKDALKYWRDNDAS